MPRDGLSWLTVSDLSGCALHPSQRYPSGCALHPSKASIPLHIICTRQLNWIL